jgi:predicted amidohydrolase
VEEWAPPGTAHRWTGYAFAIDPLGHLIAEADPADNSEKMLLAELNPAALADARYPIEVKTARDRVVGDFLSVRRVETFSRILERSSRAGAP